MSSLLIVVNCSTKEIEHKIKDSDTLSNAGGISLSVIQLDSMATKIAFGVHSYSHLIARVGISF
jgi:hypothetical protein